MSPEQYLRQKVRRAGLQLPVALCCRKYLINCMSNVTILPVSLLN